MTRPPPPAPTQLVKLGKQTETEVFELGTSVAPPEIARRGVEEGVKRGVDVVIVDTAGRLQVDAEVSVGGKTLVLHDEVEGMLVWGTAHSAVCVSPAVAAGGHGRAAACS